VKVYLHAFLTWTLDGGELSASRPDHFIPGQRIPGTDWIGGWVGPRAGLNVVARRKYPSSCWKSNFGRPVRSLLFILLTDLQQLTGE